MAFSDQDVLSWFNVNQGATDADIAKAMQQHGIGQLQIARVTGANLDDVTKRFNVATGQPEWTNRDVPMSPAQPQGMMQPPTTATPAPQQQGISDEMITGWLRSNPNASDADIRKAMDANGVTVSQMARASQAPLADIQRRYDYAYMPKPTVAPTQPSKPIVNLPAAGDYTGVANTTGMVQPQTSGDYQNQMNQYYSAYFGGGQPDQGLLSSWYNTPFTPPVTGYQKPQASTSPQTTQAPTGSGSSYAFGGTTTTGSGSSSAPGGQGISKASQEASLNAMALAENPAIKAMSPVVAAALGVIGRLGADSQIDRETAADQKAAAIQTLNAYGFQTISDEDGNIRSITTPASIAAADEGMFGNTGGISSGSYGSDGSASGFGGIGASTGGWGGYGGAYGGGIGDGY